MEKNKQKQKNKAYKKQGKSSKCETGRQENVHKGNL